MTSERSPDAKFEIGHVLFIDIVGYSKLLINEQSEQIRTLKEIVRGTEQFRLAKAEGKLLGLPTGDGGALVFRNSLEAPVLCAMEITRALKDYPKLRVRIGIHSGPVNEISDLNEQANIAGAGINMAQRVMDCGDAGHILLSRHVAEDLETYPRWQPCLHNLGEFEVKHGARIGIVSLHDDQIGNPRVPKKLQVLRQRRARARLAGIAGALLLLAGIVAAFVIVSKKPPKSTLTAPEKSIAVLPFENLSEEKANAFFADGVQDEILTDLAKVADLKVISRTSVIGYRDTAGRNLRKIGQELGVAHLLEGSVQRSGNRVRVNAQLIDARNDAHLWGQTYDRDLADVFVIQSEIAKTIADQLQAKLSPSEKSAIERPPTNDITAFDLYTRAKDLLLTAAGSSAGKADYLQAIDLLNQAVARDPSFFQAYCRLAQAHDSLYSAGYDHTSARLALADAAIEAASRLRPNAGETHLARARNIYQGYRDYNGALAELELARQTLPNDSRVFELTGYIQRRQPGRYEESTRTLERAIELDPRNVVVLQQIASFNYPRLRRYADAKSAWDRLLAITPDNAPDKAERAMVDFDWKGDTRPLHQMIDSIRATNPAAVQSIAERWIICALAERDAVAANNALIAFGENPIALSSENVRFNRPFVEGVIARMNNDDAKARSAFTAARVEQEKIVQAQPNYGHALCVLGLIDAGLGRKEEALREGRRAVELLPMEKDAPDGAEVVKYLAMTAAWIGDKDLACEQLAIAIRGPSNLSYGQLKLMPFWDSLRGDPRFEQMVASLAPNETK
jgi:TolB-like protein/class 3 adenylate cyclase/Tfp pilus assembly protein PilF